MSDPTKCGFGNDLNKSSFLDIEVHYGFADADRTFSTRYLVNGEYKRRSASWDYPNAMKYGDSPVIDYNDYLNRFGGICILIMVLVLIVIINFICNLYNNCCKSKCKIKDKYESVKGKLEYESDVGDV